MLQRKVRATIEKYGMLKKGDTVIVAVSGGADSVALLHVLNSIKDLYGVSLHAAHFEHGIRGKESIEDMEFVKSLCEQLKVSLTIGSADVPSYARSEGLSLEHASRKLRYEFLEGVMKERSAQRIATGHNANDQAETLVLNLLRGVGFVGLGGIRVTLKDKIIRPLIEVRRQEIEDYLSEKGLKFKIDRSNLETHYERNRIRHILVPLLERDFNPAIVDLLTRTATTFAMLNDYLQDQVDNLMTVCRKEDDARTVIELEKFQTFPAILRMLAVYRMIRSYEADDQVATFDSVNAVINLAERSRSGSRVEIGSGIVALKEFDNLVIGRDLAMADDYEVTLNIPGTTRIEKAECTIEIEIIKGKPADPEIYRGGDAAYFDFDKIDLPLIARNWREGDRLIPFGLGGSKKVHDIFIDEKVPVTDRSKIPVICDREGILWIAAVRRADRARITDDTETILKIIYRKDRG
ncbi:MAG: tRNA lysidine(34) synthetase TilS [bacterium]